MEYTVCPAQLPDLGRIQEIYGYARDFMEKNGNPNQWGKTYPPIEQIKRDIAEGKLYVITDGQIVHGVFFFWIGPDPTYQKIDGTWRSDSPYGTIHRIAGDGSGGILKTAVAFAEERIGHLRMDTHEDNRVMQSALTELGFQPSGMIRLEDGSPRIAYDYLKMDERHSFPYSGTWKCEEGTTERLLRMSR